MTRFFSRVTVQTAVLPCRASMASSRSKYDSCAYESTLHQSVAPLDYIMDPIKYHNCNKCRMELGIVGGTAVSHVAGNLIDLENDLRGQNRPLTKCQDYMYQPSNDFSVQGKEMHKPVTHPKVDTHMLHLPPCQMIGYGQVPAAAAPNPYTCPPRPK